MGMGHQGATGTLSKYFRVLTQDKYTSIPPWKPHQHIGIMELHWHVTVSEWLLVWGPASREYCLVSNCSLSKQCTKKAWKGSTVRWLMIGPVSRPLVWKTTLWHRSRKARHECWQHGCRAAASYWMEERESKIKEEKSYGWKYPFCGILQLWSNLTKVTKKYIFPASFCGACPCSWLLFYCEILRYASLRYLQQMRWRKFCLWKPLDWVHLNDVVMLICFFPSL